MNERDQEFENLKKYKNTKYNLEKGKILKNKNSIIGLFKPIIEKRNKYIENYIIILFFNYYYKYNMNISNNKSKK